MTESLSQPNLPWAPIYTVSEPSQPEQIVHGIVYVWVEDRSLYANVGRSLLKIGDTHLPVWCHSLLNPFLLMTLLPTLKSAYPTLKSEHWAMLMNTDSDETRLNELIALANLKPESLQCLPCASMQTTPTTPGCPGLHVANALYHKTLGDNTQPMHALLRELLAYLLGREDFAESTEHCSLPTLALSAVETAQLYHALILPLPRDLIRQCPDELTDSLECWNEIAALMRESVTKSGAHPALDAQLMNTFNAQEPAIPLIAKVDPNGLLCMGIGPNPKFADGLGIYIQLAPNQAPESLEMIASTLLTQLGFAHDLATPPKHSHFHFDLQGSVLPQ